jgi:hypothetical protein
LNLATFDDRLLNGLDFCRKVYDLFEQVRSGPEGVRKLRLRPTKSEKRLIEELIPIARYVQARYSEGRRIKVRWLSGSQPYDAVLWSSGGLVEHGVAPRRLFVEVTVATHQNEYLTRQALEEQGGSFGPKIISREKKTGRIVSEPYVHTNDELVVDLSAQIIDRIKTKAAKRYPPGTVLIVQCFPNSLILDSEWNEAIERVNRARVHLAFREVYVFGNVMSHSATLYGERKRRRSRKRNRNGQ